MTQLDPTQSINVNTNKKTTWPSWPNYTSIRKNGKQTLTNFIVSPTKKNIQRNIEKNGIFEHLEDLFHTTLRMQTNLTENMKINHFHAHLRGLVLKTSKPTSRLEHTTRS